MENRALLAVMFQDINPDNSDLDAGGQPNGASMGRINGLATVGRQDLGTANNDIFYAATEWGGLYKTTNGGVNWSFLDKHLPLATWDVEVNPASTNRVFATSFYDGRVATLSGIQVSLDAGADWFQPLSAVANPAFENTSLDNTPQTGYTCANPRDEAAAFGIAIQPDATQNVFIGTNCGLARSTDGGTTWQFLDPTATVAGVAATPGNVVWDVAAQAGGIIDVVGTVGHRRSLDGGNTWSANNLPGGATAAPSQMSIAVSPDENYVLFATGNDNQIYESDNGGTNWVSLGTADPQRGGGRLPFVVTNQRTDAAGPINRFDVWTGGVSMYRVACTTPAAPAPSNITLGGGRCPAGLVAPPAAMQPGPLPAVGWFGGWTSNGLGAATGAHDDVGDIVFDVEAANDAIPVMMTSDGGVYRATTNNANPQNLGDLTWEQPTVGPHAMWLYAMAGVNQPNAADEDLYLGLQDDGSWATRRAVPTTADWDNIECCDVFDISADGTRVLSTFTGPFRVFLRNPGMVGGANITTAFLTNLPGALPLATSNVPVFNFPDFIDQVGNNQYVAATPSGLFLTNDVTVNPVVWNQIGAASSPAGGFCGVQAANSGGTPTFYAQTSCIGSGETQGPTQVWQFVGTGAGNWAQIDNNDGLAGGFGIFAVDPNNPNRLYASNFGGPAGIQMVSSTDAGTNWAVDADLNNLMTGAGSFKFQTQTGPSSFAHTFGFQGYVQPSLLAYDPENPNNIVAGGRDSGVFLSTDSGTSWRLLSDPFDSGNSGVPHLPRPFFAYFDHEPADTTALYIGMQGRGVWRIFIDANGFNLPPDRFEPNDTIGTSTVLGSLQKITERDLTIHNTTDVDFFQYTAQDTGKLIINTFFDLNGDLDLRVRDSSGDIIATGTQTNVAGGRVRENLVIPVVTQQRYYIEIFSGAQHTNEYDLEIENFAAPVPIAVDLDPISDTGRDDTDDNTFDAAPRVRILADLRNFAGLDIPILTPAQAAGGVTAGAAVQVFLNGIAVGFAAVIPGTDNTLFDRTLAANDLDNGFPIFPPGNAGAPERGWLNLVTSAVRIFDGQTPLHANGRADLSEPLIMTFDNNAPAPPSPPDLLATSDAGCEPDDNMTNVNPPAFGGTAEMNTLIRIFANGVLVGEGKVGSDLTDGILGNGLGAWEVTIEPLADGEYTITATVEDLAGNLSSAAAMAGTLVIDTLAPQRPTLDLLDESDSGRHDKDNVTRETTLTFRVTAEPGSHVVIKDGNTVIDSFIMPNAPFTDRTIDFAAVLPPLGIPVEGDHLLSAESTDCAGNRSAQSEELIVTIDLTAPAPPTIAIDPASSDTGVTGYPATIVDRVTSDTSTGFVGTAEADAIVRLYANTVFDGLTVALPEDGNKAFPNGQWNQAGILDLNDPGFFPLDGLRTINATAEDLAGNESELGTLLIFIDTAGPQVTAVHITDNPATAANEAAFDLFDPKPLTAGPTPRVDSLSIDLRDLPSRVAGFLYDALHAGVASQPGHYVLRGDHNGIIPVSQVIVSNTAAALSPATATVQLRFSSPLPDDRFTLTLSDTLVDPAGNALDGENNAQEPLEVPLFPTGDGQPGGNFVARFTVDSRPELGTYINGAVHVDINGNGYWDPTGNNNDYTNRDLAFAFASRQAKLIAGDFAPAGALSSSGFDKLAAYDQGSNPHRWVFDFDHNGTVDLNVVSGVQGNGDPIVGDWSAAHPGDEIGFFNGQKFFLDAGGNNNVGDANDLTLNANFGGTAFAGDFDGDGKDDLATYKDGLITFDLAADGLDGSADTSFTFSFFGPFERPVAADLNLDGIDDIGLFITERSGPPPSEVGDWFWLISTGAPVAGTVNTLNHRFSPAPLGNDLFFQFGDVLALPIVGNFDPPIALELTQAQNPVDPLDVNRDGDISPLDALLIFNELNAAGSHEMPVPALGPDGEVWSLDVSGDAVLSAIDALMIFNHLNAQSPAVPAAESAAQPSEISSAELDLISLLADDQVTSRQRRRR